MPSEKEAIERGIELWHSLDRNFLAITALLVLGTMARSLLSNEPFDFRKLLGELILGLIGAVLLYAFGMLQNMSPMQMLFLGALGGLGGVRSLEWVIKFIQHTKKTP